jgi:heme A synthase
MTSWESIVGGIVGLLIAVGGLVSVGWAALALANWANKDMKPQDPALDDEDEIDHRFY